MRDCTCLSGRGCASAMNGWNWSVSWSCGGGGDESGTANGSVNGAVSDVVSGTVSVVHVCNDHALHDVCHRQMVYLPDPAALDSLLALLP